MLAKKFRLQVQSWMKDKDKKAITKKGNFFIVKTLPNNLGFSRFGAIIGLKTAKKAFRRNYLKRTIFDFIRLNNFHLRPGKDFLLIVSSVAGESAKADIEKELNLLLA
jgi:ribonuclease P protein component